MVGISEEGETIVIGAMTPYAVVASEVGSTHAGLLAKAAQTVADPQIRHRGTVGSLVHADPAGDVGAPVLALGAEFVIAGAMEDRRWRPTTSSRTSSRRRSGGRALDADPDPEAHRVGLALREVRAGQPPVVDRRGRRNRARVGGGMIAEARVG